MLTWNLHPVAFSLGPFQVRWYGLCLLVALLGGFRLWRRQLLRAGRSGDCARHFLLLGLLGVLIGGRIGHLVFYNWDVLLDRPWEVFGFWRGGLASHGSSAGLLLALLAFARWQRLRFLDVADRLTFSCAWGAGWVRIGNFCNSEIVGRATSLPWGIRFPYHASRLPAEAVLPRHPAQLYEAALAAAVFAALVWTDRKAGKERRPEGLLAAVLLVLLFSGRFLLEFTKESPAVAALGLSLSPGQWLSLPFILAGLIGLAWRRHRPVRPEPLSPAK